MAGYSPMNELQALLSQHYFQGLFIEHLGWDHVSGSLTVTTDGQPFGFEAIAQKARISGSPLCDRPIDDH